MSDDDGRAYVRAGLASLWRDPSMTPSVRALVARVTMHVFCETPTGHAASAYPPVARNERRDLIGILEHAGRIATLLPRCGFKGACELPASVCCLGLCEPHFRLSCRLGFGMQSDRDHATHRPATASAPL